MEKDISVEYLRVAESFSKYLSAEMGDRIDAIIIYGSVARKEARKDSDIDLMIVTKYANDVRFLRKLYHVKTTFEQLEDFRFLISLFTITPEMLKKEKRMNTPFISNVKNDAIKLYGKTAI